MATSEILERYAVAEMMRSSDRRLYTAGSYARIGSTSGGGRPRTKPADVDLGRDLRRATIRPSF